MRGDALASGDKKATFSVAPNLKFSEGQMRDDLLNVAAGRMSNDEFIIKYMVTQRELDLLLTTDSEEKISSFAEEMKQRADAYTKQLADEHQQEQRALHRDCFITPFVVEGLIGRVIVSRDGAKEKPSNLYIPRSMRKDKTLMPTTGHVIKETISPAGIYSLLGKRILFGTMSGTPICFKNYPTWIMLELTEILGIIEKEDAELEEQELEPLI